MKEKQEKNDKNANLKRQQKKDEFIVALEKSAGVISAACRATGIKRSLIYDWLEVDEDFAKKVEDTKEVVADFVESKLYELINGASRQVVIRTQEVKTITDENGRTFDKVINVSRPITIQDAPDNASIIFWLKTRGRSRGYNFTDADGNNTGGVVVIEA